MMGAHSDGSIAWYGLPAGLWIIFFVGLASAIVAVIVAWRSNVNNQRYLDEQLTRGWQQLVRQLKHEAEQRGKQRVHETEQLSKQFEHDADQKAKELQHSLRRDTYLEAAAALLNIHTLISRAATMECNETLLRESFADNHARVVKVHLIATEPTVEVLMIYMNELAPAFVELTARRRQIRARARVLRGQSHETVLDSDDNGQYRKRVTAELLAAQSEERVELLRRSVSLTTQSAKLLATSLLALRSEMGGPLDRRRYEQLWQIQFGKMEPVWKQDIENLRPPPPSHLPDLINRIFP
jgi:hypothetical protein